MGTRGSPGLAEVHRPRGFPDSPVPAVTQDFRVQVQAGTQDSAVVLPVDIQGTADRVIADILRIVDTRVLVDEVGTRVFLVIAGAEFPGTADSPVKAVTQDFVGTAGTRVTQGILEKAGIQGIRGSAVCLGIQDTPA